MDREFDICVWGASGFTGSLVAEFVARTYRDTPLRWAIAGRSSEKLEKLRAEIGLDALGVIQADSHDRSSLDALAARSKVVLSAVGPFAHLGSPLVAACVEKGSHYCDLAGEVQWIRAMIDRHHDRAARNKVRIVHCCGFDSVPMDLGVYFMQQQAVELHGAPCRSITMVVKASKGTFSGGTYASMLNVFEQARAERSLAQVLVDPYSLNPPAERHGPDTPDQRGVRHDDGVGSWTAPFVMAPINTKVIRRSHALLGFPWGRDFRYREAVMTGGGASGFSKASAIALGLGVFMSGASYGASRWLLKRYFLPKPGEGPDRQTREQGFFDLRLFGMLQNGELMRARVTGEGDPGYSSTSRMVAEAAVCLAEDNLDAPFGVLTPASAMAQPLLDRLQARAGLRFEIV